MISPSTVRNDWTCRSNCSTCRLSNQWFAGSLRAAVALQPAAIVTKGMTSDQGHRGRAFRRRRWTGHCQVCPSRLWATRMSGCLVILMVRIAVAVMLALNFPASSAIPSREISAHPFVGPTTLSVRPGFLSPSALLPLHPRSVGQLFRILLRHRLYPGRQGLAGRRPTGRRFVLHVGPEPAAELRLQSRGGEVARFSNLRNPSAVTHQSRAEHSESVAVVN